MRLLAAIGLLLALAAPARADPAIFVVRGGVAPLYLLGSIHYLRPGIAWRTPTLARVLGNARSYWFETTEKPTAATMLNLVSGVDLFRSLETMLGPEDYARLKLRLNAKEPGSMLVINHLRPWLAAMVVIAMQAKNEPDTLAGVDEQLMADPAGKPIHGLETIGDIVEMMNAVPDDGQLAMLRSALRPTAKQSAAAFNQLQAAWLAGDLDKIGAFSQTLQAASPDMYRTLLKQRNERWIETLDGLLHEDASTLVTVGAAHLVGPEGLPALLRRRGYKVERLQ